ncbi:hypothetical protein J6590_061495 [Homalodisca vitripennis]|nr:hypothetical protein J6590_061495 [Homalodisca vitripennis]
MSRVSVLGVCKPRARLLGVVERSQPPPPGSCRVLIAGAIYQHLENQITMRTRTGKVMVSTVSYRHVNQQSTRVKNYIRELCIRCKGSVLLDINAIGRRHSTRHGQHLTMRGGGCLPNWW